MKFMVLCFKQGCVLHAAVSDKPGQALPPCSSAWVICRNRFLVPPPHSFEHVEYFPKLLTTQSTLQGCVLQFTDSDKRGQAFPPSALALMILRDRFCIPPPHCFEHGDNAPKVLTTQSTFSIFLARGLDARMAGLGGNFGNRFFCHHGTVFWTGVWVAILGTLPKKPCSLDVSPIPFASLVVALETKTFSSTCTFSFVLASVIDKDERNRKTNNI